MHTVPLHSDSVVDNKKSKHMSFTKDGLKGNILVIYEILKREKMSIDV